jgi:hypothetical protein
MQYTVTHGCGFLLPDWSVLLMCFFGRSRSIVSDEPILGECISSAPYLLNRIYHRHVARPTVCLYNRNHRRVSAAVLGRQILEVVSCTRSNTTTLMLNHPCRTKNVPVVLILSFFVIVSVRFHPLIITATHL